LFVCNAPSRCFCDLLNALFAEKIEAQKAVITALKVKYPTWKDTPVAEVDSAIAALKALIHEQKAEEKKNAPVKTGAASSSATSATTAAAPANESKHLLR
jgi:hypothetical protein